MVRPSQNLPPGSQQWARSIENDVNTLLRDSERENQTQNNTLKGLSNSLVNLGELVQTLAEQQQQLTAQQAQLTSTVASLAEQQSYLTSLRSRNASSGGWSTSSISADGVWHWDGPVATLDNLEVPTGKVRVFLSATNALASTVSSVPGLLQVGLTYSISGGVQPVGESFSYVSSEIGNNTSAPIVHIGTVTMTPGTYSFSAYRGYRCYTDGGSKFASVANTRLIVEVVNND